MDRAEELDPIAEYWIAHGPPCPRKPQTVEEWREYISAEQAQLDDFRRLLTNPLANGEIALAAVCLGLIFMLILSVAP